MNRIVYLHGFASSPHSRKARWFAERFAERGVEIAVPDLAAGDFEHLTISGQLRLIEELCQGRPVTLIGSSMGGYLAALYAARHPEVEKLVMLAPAFCFAKRSMMLVGPPRFMQWRISGTMQVFHYGEQREVPLSYGIVEDGQQYEDFPEFRQPALIFHGIQDVTVPYSLSKKFATNHDNVRLWLLDSGHELTDSMEMMWDTTVDFLGLGGAECGSEEEWVSHAEK